jgi:hypothetical protein
MIEKKDAETQAREAWENVYSEAWGAAKARGVEYPDRVVEAGRDGDPIDYFLDKAF